MHLRRMLKVFKDESCLAGKSAKHRAPSLNFTYSTMVKLFIVSFLALFGMAQALPVVKGDMASLFLDTDVLMLYTEVVPAAGDWAVNDRRAIGNRAFPSVYSDFLKLCIQRRFQRLENGP
jgi:hypothetical protein